MILIHGNRTSCPLAPASLKHAAFGSSKLLPRSLLFPSASKPSREERCRTARCQLYAAYSEGCCLGTQGCPQGQAKQPVRIRMHGPGTGGRLVCAGVCVGSGTSERRGKGVGRHLPEPPQLLLWERCSTFRRQKCKDHLHYAQPGCAQLSWHPKSPIQSLLLQEAGPQAYMGRDIRDAWKHLVKRSGFVALE